MNIKDAEVDLSKFQPNWLEAIFEQQQALMDKYDHIEHAKGIDAHAPVDLHTCRGQQRIKDLMWRLVEEVGEAANCLKNKPWKQTEVLTDIDHYHEELADAFHFMIELFIASGLSAEDLMKLYFKKAQVNQFRQTSQY